MEVATPTLSVEEILTVVERCGGLAGVRNEATDTERAGLYTSMGGSASTTHNATRSDLGWTPLLQRCVGGPKSTLRPYRRYGRRWTSIGRVDGYLCQGFVDADRRTSPQS